MSAKGPQSEHHVREFSDRFLQSHFCHAMGLWNVNLSGSSPRKCASMCSCAATRDAAIYSPDAARVAAASRVGEHEHIDWHVLGPMPLKFTFNRPIAWQKWDWRNRSENSRTWCADRGAFADIHRECAWLYHRALGMHTELGWRRMYVIQKYKPFIVITLTPLLALLAAFLALRAFRALLSRNAAPVS